MDAGAQSLDQPCHTAKEKATYTHASHCGVKPKTLSLPFIVHLR